MVTESEQKRIENEKRQAELAQCYKRFAKTEDGKEILKDLEWICCQNRTSIGNDENKWNTNQVFYHEGMRNVFLYINQKINRKEIEKNG